jgi:hypothetical protein
MANKRARISDRNPLTATDGVIAGYEQVNKSISQDLELDERQDDLLTFEQVNKLASGQAEKLASQPVDQLDSSSDANREVLGERDLVETGQQVSKLANQLSSKSASQQVSKLTSQEFDQLTIQPADKPTSDERENVEVRLSQQVSKLASQEAEKSTNAEPNQLESQQVDNPTSQLVNKSILKKATFKLDSEVITALDRYHLQLQIDLGKQDAPYKETIVEEAIAQWLERSAKSPDRAIKSLAKRQERR